MTRRGINLLENLFTYKTIVASQSFTSFTYFNNSKVEKKAKIADANVPVQIILVNKNKDVSAIAKHGIVSVRAESKHGTHRKQVRLNVK